MLLPVQGIYTRFLSSFGVLTLCFVLLIACSSSTPPPPATPSMTALPVTPTSALPPTILYQADWSKGLADWQASAGWKVKKGFIESDLSDNLSLQLPYHITADSYAIEVTVQVVSVPKDGGQFQFVADQQQEKDGYTADILNLLAPGKHALSVHALAEVLLAPDASMGTLPRVIDYEPGNQYRVYRVEVKGSRVEFKVDGQTASRAIDTQTATLSNGPIRILSRAAILRISSFRVLTN